MHLEDELENPLNVSLLIDFCSTKVVELGPHPSIATTRPHTGESLAETMRRIRVDEVLKVLTMY